MLNSKVQYKLTILASALLVSVCATVSAQSTTDGYGAESQVSVEAELAKPALVVLSDTFGDAGYEMLLSDTVRRSGSELDQQTEVLLVYANIDSLEASEKTFAVLDQALARGLPVVLESNNWDVSALHAFVQKYDAEVSLKGLKNVALELSMSTEGQVQAVDTTPSEVAMIAGVPYEKTSEAQAYAQLHTATLAPVHPFAPFASAAYSTNPGNTSGWVLRVNNDIYKIWTLTQGTTRSCMVSMRGSNSIGDWARNGQSEFTTSTTPYTGYQGSARIGRGWRTRLDNVILAINNSVDSFGCTVHHTTGHSLGGAMAAVVAFALDRRFGDPIYNVVGFNAARTGNAAFRDEFNASTSRQPLLFCRHLDPVWPLPTGFVHFSNGANGCTHWYPSVSTIFPWRNHSMGLWL
ncbi:MAG: hypothetical protein Tsb002_13140 [Wenzhouxiangellaceae bacterium]